MQTKLEICKFYFYRISYAILCIGVRVMSIIVDTLLFVILFQ